MKHIANGNGLLLDLTKAAPAAKAKTIGEG
jgi:hypothetical protein